MLPKSDDLQKTALDFRHVFPGRDGNDYSFRASEIIAIFRYAGFECHIEVHADLGYVTRDWFTGYVQLPKSHPYFDSGYGDFLDLKVHGGVTYLNRGLVGFDTNHRYSPGITLERVVDELKGLATQLAERDPKWMVNTTQEALNAALERFHHCNPHTRGGF